MGDNLKEKSIHVIKWSAVDRVLQQAIQFIVGLILARTLPIEAFGLIGIVFIFNSLSFVLVDSGFGQSLIREKCDSEKEFSTIFIFNLTVSVFVYAILFLSAPLIAKFFNQPELVKISRIAFLTIPLNSLYLVSWTKLVIKLDYRKTTIVSFLSALTSGSLAVFMAFKGFGVWALVWQMVIFHTCRVIFFNMFERISTKLFFSFDILKKHLKFSVNLLFTGILDTIYNNIFTFFIARFLSLKELSFYNQANKLSENINYSFVVIFGMGTYNIFAKINDDLERLKRLFIEFMQRVAVIVIPTSHVLIAVSNNLIVVLIGERWAASVVFFQLIGAAMVFAPLYKINLNTLNVRGHSKLTFQIELLKKLLITIISLPLLYFGSKYMLAAYVLICWAIYILSIFKINKELKINLNAHLSLITKPLFIGGLLMLVAWIASFVSHNIYISLSVQLLACGITYIILIKLFYKKIFLQLLSYLKIRKEE